MGRIISPWTMCSNFSLTKGFFADYESSIWFVIGIDILCIWLFYALKKKAGNLFPKRILGVDPAEVEEKGTKRGKRSGKRREMT